MNKVKKLKEKNMPSSQRQKIQFLSLKNQNYDLLLKKQFELREKRQKNQISDTVLCVEHPPVITQGRREVGEDFILSPKELKKKGFQIFKVNRGGRLTYHGPGQWVVYFIFSLKERKLKVSEFVRVLEDIMMKTCETFDVQAERREGCPGLWFQNKKLGSIGLSIDRGVSMHGFALNINPNLEHYDYIIPCGIKDCHMTSISKEIHRALSMEEVLPVLKQSILDVF